jgi:hypothetical protein
MNTSELKNLIKKTIRPDKQELVYSEVMRIKSVWNDLSSEEKEDWFDSDGTIGFFFETDENDVFEDNELFIDTLSESEQIDVFDKFIDFSCE